MTKRINLQSDDIDLEPVSEDKPRFDTIYDEMVYERSSQDADWVDPAVRVKMRSTKVNDFMYKYKSDNFDLLHEFSVDIQEIRDRWRQEFQKIKELIQADRTVIHSMYLQALKNIRYYYGN